VGFGHSDLVLGYQRRVWFWSLRSGGHSRKPKAQCL